MTNENLIYLNTCILQKDMRIRLPKNILENLSLEKGKSKLKIYYDKSNQQLILKVDKESNDLEG